MAEQTGLRKLLVLQGPALQAEGFIDFLRGHFNVELAGDLESALGAMRQTSFDAVLAQTSDFLPLERGVVTQQAAVILDTLGDGVCIVGPGGQLVWANRRAKEFPTDVLEGLRSICAQAYGEFSAGAAGGADGERGRRFSLMPQDGSYYEVICSPVRDSQGAVRQVAAVVVNATHHRRQQLKLNAIDRAGRELVRLDYDVLRHRDASERLRFLEERILRCSRDVLHYQHFAVLLLNERTNRLEMLISEGLDAAAEKLDLLANTEGNGICGYVAATGRSYVCQDVTKDPRYLPGLKGARSSLTVPLRLHDQVIGVLNVESAAPAAFGEEDRQFAEIFANYVAIAMHIMNLLVFERHTTRTQVSGSFCAELSGPLNDMISEAGELKEDYIGHDDLRPRLDALIDQLTEARRRVQALASPPESGVLPAPPGPVQKDPILTGKRILVADDEEVMRRTLRDVLVPYGCRVDLAADGAQARRMLSSAAYDLVISDIKMPGATGYEVFEAARAARGDVKVILITAFGYDPHHSIVRANREGLAAVLMKPFKVKHLLEQCRAALGAQAK